MRHNFSLVAHYSLKTHLLVVTCFKITRYSLQNSLVVKNHSLFVVKFARYLFQKLLIAKNHSLLIAEFACYSFQKLLIAKNHSLLIAEFARTKKSLVLRYENSPETNVYLNAKRIRRVSSKNVVFNNIANFTGKRIWPLFSWSCNILKKELQHRCLPVNFAKVTSAHFCQNTCKWLLLFINICTIYFSPWKYQCFSTIKILGKKLKRNFKRVGFLKL